MTGADPAVHGGSGGDQKVVGKGGKKRHWEHVIMA